MPQRITLPQKQKTSVAATGSKRELLHAPTAGEALPHSKGEPGPWGPVFSAVIP
jgi:hypothetical protein